MLFLGGSVLGFRGRIFQFPGSILIIFLGIFPVFFNHVWEGLFQLPVTGFYTYLGSFLINFMGIFPVFFNYFPGSIFQLPVTGF